MTLYKLHLACCFYIKNTILKDLTTWKCIHVKRQDFAIFLKLGYISKYCYFGLLFQYKGFDPNLEMSFDFIFENVHACAFMKGREMINVLIWVRTKHSVGSCCELCYYNLGLTYELENLESIKRLHHLVPITFSYDFPYHTQMTWNSTEENSCFCIPNHYLITFYSCNRFFRAWTLWDTICQSKVVKNPVTRTLCSSITLPVLS